MNKSLQEASLDELMASVLTKSGPTAFADILKALIQSNSSSNSQQSSTGAIDPEPAALTNTDQALGKENANNQPPTPSRKRKWPVNFEFPKELLAENQVGVIQDTDAPEKKRTKIAVQAVFDKMKQIVDSGYPTHDQYYAAAKSITTEFPHMIDHTESGHGSYLQILKNKFTYYRQSDPSFKNSPQAVASKLKYTTKKIKEKLASNIDQSLVQENNVEESRGQ